MQIETEHLQTIKNYAASKSVTPAYLYKLIKEEKMQCVIVDGVKFIDKSRFKEIQNKAWWNNNFNLKNEK